MAQTSDPTYPVFAVRVAQQLFRAACGPLTYQSRAGSNSIIPFGYHNSNVLENFTKAKLNDADRKYGKFSASALFIFCEPNFLLGNPKGTDIWSFELHK